MQYFIRFEDGYTLTVQAQTEAEAREAAEASRDRMMGTEDPVEITSIEERGNACAFGW